MKTLRTKRRAQSRRFTVELWDLEARLMLSAAADGALLVEFSSQAGSDLVSRVAAARGATTESLGVAGLLKVVGSAASLAAVTAGATGAPGVLSIGPDQVEHIALAPNDPEFTAGHLYGLNGTYGINAPQAWGVYTGSPPTGPGAATGTAAAIVADIDTGIDYNHPDLSQNIWINQPEIPASRMKNLTDVYGDGYISWRDLNNPANIGPGKITDLNGDGVIDAADILTPMTKNGNGVDTGTGGWADPSNVQDGDTAHPDDLIGWNFVTNTNNPLDDNGHGTHTAGILGASGNNGVGVVGVNWTARIMALKFIDSSGSGSKDAAIQAINYASLHGAKVANASWGSSGGDQLLSNAIGNSGLVFVAAAGNNGTNNASAAFYPASYNLPNIISVAASDQTGTIASFSNYGATSVNLAAPGVSIESTLPGNNYGYLNGTSMATPFVTGTVALLAGLHPTWTVAQLIQRVESTVTKVSTNVATETIYGGIVNAGAALAPAAAAGVLFSDDFGGPSLGPAWATVGGVWSQRGGVLGQTARSPVDPQKALITDKAYPADVEIDAAVRVDSWGGGDGARAGVALAQGAGGLGYNLVFRDGGVQFLDDQVRWGNYYQFAWQVGTWYQFKLRSQGGVLSAKVWQDGTAEPAGWMFTQAGWSDRTSGAPGLNGGSGTSTASFDNVSVVGLSAAAPAPPPAPTGLTASAASSSQINLTWSAPSGATGYAVDRSPDGTTGWAQAGTTASATAAYQDGGLNPGTTYYYRVRAINSGGSSAPSAVAAATTPAAAAGVLFSDDFGGPSLGPAWATVGGVWSQRGGVLGQTARSPVDPQKALITDKAYPADVEIDAAVRVDSWGGGDGARAGVALAQGAGGLGYNLVFRDGGVQFLDDQVRWGNYYQFAWQVGTWYQFKLRSQGGVLSAKVWQDGTAEPAGWMFTQAGWSDRTSGAPGLNGGSGTSTASFDNVSVVGLSAAAPAPPPAPTGLTASAASSSQINLTWSAPSGATGYAVDRSPDGTTGWAQAGTTASATAAYQDGGLNPGTTYYYRVRAINSGGSSAPSAVAAATTPAAAAGVLFSDDFGGPSLGPAWATVGGVWSQRGGVLGQTARSPVDPQKALITDKAYPADVEIDAAVRVDSWGGGDGARAGVALAQGAGGLGYNLVFRDGGVQFLDDQVRWGNYYQFAWQVGTWYQFKLRSQGGVLSAKVWQDGTAEPAGWMFTQAGWSDRTSGAPGLNGGSGTSTASFDNVSVVGLS